jgi:hypothetical protein
MKPDREPVVLLDMDGTVADYIGKMERDLEDLRGPDEPVHKFDHDELTPRYIKNRIRLIKESENWWYDLPKMQDGFNLMNKARSLGFDINVLTKGPYNTDQAWSQKYKWCRQYLPKDTKVTITEDKGLMYGLILIDDYPAYLKRWLTWRPRGLGIMPKRSYNKDFTHPNVVIYDGTNMDEIEERMQHQLDRHSDQRPTFDREGD